MHLECTALTRLADQQAPGILLVPTSQCQDYRHVWCWDSELKPPWLNGKHFSDWVISGGSLLISPTKNIAKIETVQLYNQFVKLKTLIILRFFQSISLFGLIFLLSFHIIFEIRSNYVAQTVPEHDLPASVPGITASQACALPYLTCFHLVLSDSLSLMATAKIVPLSALIRETQRSTTGQHVENERLRSAQP